MLEWHDYQEARVRAWVGLAEGLTKLRRSEEALAAYREAVWQSPLSVAARIYSLPPE